MNDFNRRGFLGTLIASVAALFAGKRTEASSRVWGKCEDCGHAVLIDGSEADQEWAYENGHGIVETLNDGKVVKRQCIPCFHRPAFQPGDIVLFDACYASSYEKVFCGVVLDWSDHAYFDRNVRVYRVDTPHGLLCLLPDLSVQTPTYGAVKISHVNRTDPGAWSMYGSKDGKQQAILCKPTQSVKAGQLLEQMHFHSYGAFTRVSANVKDIEAKWSEIGPANQWLVPGHVLGFAASDVTVPLPQQTAEVAPIPRDWCWCVPQGPDLYNQGQGRPYLLDVSNYGDECRQIDGIA